MGVIDDLIPDIDGILGIRDDLGVALKQVVIVTRTWSGSRLGEGTFTETRARMLPSPRVVEFKNDLRIREGGAIKQGDVMLKMISKASYTASELEFGDLPENVEKFYELGGELYRPLGITEKHVVWNLTIRRQSEQRRS